MEKLLENGAKDIFYTPIYMKKNRPATKLSVLCNEEQLDTMEEIIFLNTSSIGVRKYKMERSVLEREIVSKNTKYGQVIFKLARYKKEEFYTPEYEDVKNICNETGLGFKQVYNDLISIINSVN